MLRCAVNVLWRLSSAGTCCDSWGPSRGESPERLRCFSTFDMISLVSSPLSVTATTIAFLWSIHKPTFVFIDVPLCLLLPPALPHVPFTDLPKMVATDREHDGLGKKPGTPELGPEQELPVVKPFLAHKAEPIERPQEREDV